MRGLILAGLIGAALGGPAAAQVERLPELAIPALVVHGRRDPFFPVGNAEALALEIRDARLLVLERAATAIPDAAAGEVAAAMLAL